MANPTTNKPATPEWDSGTNANLQFLCIFNRDAAPLDLVGSSSAQVPAKTYDSVGGFLTGLAPTIGSVSFGSVTTQKTFKWGNGTAGLCWPLRGYAAGTNVANPRTFAVTFRHSIQSGKNAAGSNNAALTVAMFGSGTDGNAVGLELSSTADGVVTLALRRGGSVGGTALLGGAALTAGTWYSVYVSLTSSTARNSNYYDHGAQAAGVKASFVDSSYSWGSGSNANGIYICNPQSTGGYNSGEIEVYAACVANEDWDSGVNANKFSDWYGDPALWARGSYAPGAGTLVAGIATNYIDTVTGITVAAARPTSGASSGAYTYQWHRSQVGPAFTPDAGTLIAGATAISYTDTNVTAGDVWYYKCAQSDGSATVNTNHATGYRPRGYLRKLLMGDSLTTAGSVAPHGQSAAAVRTKWRVAWLNRAHGARFIGTPTNSLQAQCLKPGHWSMLALTTMTAGTFTLTWRGQTTSAIAYNASVATIQTAIRALSTVGGTNATVYGAATITAANAFGVVFTGAALSGGPVSLDVLTVDSSGVTGGPLQVWSEYGNAVLAGLADGAGAPDEVDVHLGTNDAGLLGSSAATFGTDMSYFVAALLAEGFGRVRLHSPPYRWQTNSDTTADLVRQYEGVIDALCNGTTIRRGAKLYQFTVGDNDQYDGLHWGVGGFWALGFEQWMGTLSDLDPTNPALGGAGGGLMRRRR